MRATPMAQQERIRLDGVLDEEVWSRAEPAADFIQQDPAFGAPETERTEVRIVFNRESLYMGVICYDSEPDQLLGYQRRRDEFLQADDRFMWTMDTYLDTRGGYFFEINPSGLMGDALFGPGLNNRQWDGIWTAKVRRSEIGWTAEIEIPFRTLNFDPDAPAWGINFQRTVRRKNEETLWTGHARNQGLRRMSNAGVLTGIQEVSQGKGLEIKPYVMGTALASPGRGHDEWVRQGDLGLDVFYSPTPRLRANFTLNTDFAQTEVDQRQVNLTRFSLFFPEKRDFFLEGASFFDFRSTAEDGENIRLHPFFSRSIGLHQIGQSSAFEPQKIDFGTKLTGQVGQQDIGLLHVRTGREGDILGEDFTVM
ncbi:MAG: carbohydrate binding family 9 domain-containing protein, partial [Acidobacteria bacterium]|nr:carbohydrate binding family 9 domain-containing protein [Acidobacteriota bacterium]